MSIKFYRRVAKQMLRVPDHPEECRRYLSIVRRERILWRAYRAAQDAARKNSYLGQAGFKAPLSVAGEPSLVIVMSEGILKDAPVAYELDSQGRHKGTPIADLRQKLAEVAPTLEWTDRAIMGCYLEWITIRLPRRIETASRLMVRCYRERKLLEQFLAQRLQGYRRERFSILLESAQIARAILASDKPEVIVSFRAPDQVRIDGRSIQCLKGVGGGAASFYRRDVEAALRDSDFLIIEAHDDHWVAWSATCHGEKVDARTVTFAYPGGKSR